MLMLANHMVKGVHQKLPPNLKEKNMKIDKRSKECVYITINGWVYYIDDSTGEQILQKWKEEDK